METQTLPTAAIAAEPRLRRLFALVGSAIYENDIDPHAQELQDLLLDIAPEFLAPDDTDDPALWDEWRDMVNEAVDQPPELTAQVRVHDGIEGQTVTWADLDAARARVAEGR